MNKFKAILIMDFPKTCEECQFSVMQDNILCCTEYIKGAMGIILGTEKPMWCPLIPMFEDFIYYKLYKEICKQIGE